MICCTCKQEKPAGAFAWRNKARGLLARECKACHAPMRKEAYKRNKKSEIAGAIRRRRELGQWLREYKNGLKCNRCPETHPACLDFHHPDRDRVAESMQQLIRRRCWSKKRMLVELQRCEVLCANCHRKEHWSG